MTSAAAPRASAAGRPPAADAVRHLAELLAELGFAHAAIVPGAPATELQRALAASGARVVDAGNERSAAELAFGWSSGGLPALVVVKGNGAWVAAEPILNMVVHGIGAPLLVIVGDDVDAAASTVPTDIRPLGAVASVPVVELGAGDAGRRALEEAAAASLALRRPVIVRTTASLADVGPSGAQPVRPAESAVVDRTAAHRWTKATRHERATLGWEALASVLWTAPEAAAPADDARFGVIASGAMAAAVAALDPEVPVLPLGLVHPLPATAVASFAAALDEVAVLEEGLPVLEDAVQLALARDQVPARVLGRRSGHLAPGGAIDRAQLALLLRDRDGARRHRVVATSEPHPAARATAFDVVLHGLRSAVAGQPLTVHTCVGSCIAAAYQPHDLATTALELGAPIIVAAGAAEATGEAAIAVIGDYGTVHSALEDHDLVHRTGAPVLTLVLADGASAKTGGQPTACSTEVEVGRPLDLLAVLTRVADPGRVRVLAVEAIDEAGVEAAVRSALADLPATLVFTAGDHVAVGPGR